MTPQNQKLMTGAEIFFECLKREKVEYIFGYPGGAVLHIYDMLYGIDFLKHILVRHEQGATHMAEGYAKATGKPGVVLVTSGPGATNAVTGIADAYMDSIPMIVFSGQVTSQLIGNDAFQEADTTGITRSITKWNALVTKAEDIAPTVQKAFHIATTGRPGPVVIDICKDATIQQTYIECQGKIELRGYKPQVKGHPMMIKNAANAIKKARQPLIYAGGGVLFSGAAPELTQLANQTGIPVALTLHGLGGFPANNEQFLGMLGMHGTFTANQAVNDCDCLIAIGSRFDDRVTGKIDTFAAKAIKIHIDIDPSSINKNVVVDYPVVGDVKNILTDLNPLLKDKLNLDEWWRKIDSWRKECPVVVPEEDGVLRPQNIIYKLSKRTNGNAVIISDVGQNQMWTAQYFQFIYPRTHITSGGLGTMGFSVPASVGAAFGVKDKPIISISGDGGFQMNMQELITAAYHKLPIKFIIFNNGYLGMVRQWQELFHDSRYSYTDLDKSNPNFIQIAKGMGCKARRITCPEDVDESIEWMMKINDGPTVVEYVTVKEEMVFPMVPSGASVSEMILKRLNPKEFDA